MFMNRITFVNNSSILIIESIEKKRRLFLMLNLFLSMSVNK
jgi:hypothetical protein